MTCCDFLREDVIFSLFLASGYKQVYVSSRDLPILYDVCLYKRTRKSRSPEYKTLNVASLSVLSKIPDREVVPRKI